MLERISGYTAEEAKEYLLKNLEAEVTHEAAMKIKEVEARYKEEADQKARESTLHLLYSAVLPTMLPRQPSVWFPCPMTK